MLVHLDAISAHLLVPASTTVLAAQSCLQATDQHMSRSIVLLYVELESASQPDRHLLLYPRIVQTQWSKGRYAGSTFVCRLPSFTEAFTASVPLTRIRDIAHRNDIPHDLKQELKHTIQVCLSSFTIPLSDL